LSWSWTWRQSVLPKRWAMLNKTADHKANSGTDIARNRWQVSIRSDPFQFTGHWILLILFSFTSTLADTLLSLSI
jgi:hypothetical protein